MATGAGLLGQALVRRQLGVAASIVDSLRLDFSPLALCALGFVAALAKAGAGSVVAYQQKRAAFGAGDVARRAIADEILQTGAASRSATATHAAIAVRLREVERGVDEGVLAGVRSAVTLLPLLGVLIFLSSRLALTSFAFLAPFALVLAAARKWLRAGTKRASDLSEKVHADVDELVRHLDLWRTFGAGGRIRGALAVAGAQAGRAAAVADAARAAISGGNEALAALALLGAVAWSERVVRGLDSGPLVAFAAVFFLMYRPLRDVGDARIAIERGAHAREDLERLRGVGGATKVHTSVGAPGTPAWKLARLEVRALSVVRGEHATQPISFEARPGEIVALVGPTGAGKSSLLRAMLGLEADVRGEVRYGGRCVTGAGVGPSERPFAWVPQEPAIVAASVAENIALGASTSVSTRDVAFRALARIGASSLVPRLDEMLDAGAPAMSGGERQWIAIARAIASELPVLLLDEPTSGLDVASQRRVLDALEAMRGQRTVLIVTHRTEPIAIADRTIQM